MGFSVQLESDHIVQNMCLSSLKRPLVTSLQEIHHYYYYYYTCKVGHSSKLALCDVIKGTHNSLKLMTTTPARRWLRFLQGCLHVVDVRMQNVQKRGGCKQRAKCVIEFPEFVVN